MNLIFLFLATMVFLIMAMSPSVSAFVPAGLPNRSNLLHGVLQYEGIEAPAGQPLVGGIFHVDPTDDGAVDAAKYTVSFLFPSDKTSIKAVKAMSKVVRSLFYDLNVIVTFTEDGTHSLHNFEVVSITLRGKASPHTLTGYKRLYLEEDESD